MKRPARLIAAFCVSLLPAAGCTSGGTGQTAASPSGGGDVQPSPYTRMPAKACPSRYADADPNRPQVSLYFKLAPDLRSLTGVEVVTFTPDKPVDRLFFRQWLNSAESDEKATVTKVSGAGGEFLMQAGGARDDAPGTLVEIPLAQRAPAGRPITETLEFTLVFGKPEARAGSTGKTAFWGSGHPLLAWVRGDGWHTDDAGDLPGEYAVSEAAKYDVTIDAPTATTALFTGANGTAPQALPAKPPGVPDQVPAGYRRWQGHSDTARDVAAAVGTFTVRQETMQKVPVTVAVASDAQLGPDASIQLVQDQVRKAMTGLVTRFGEFPYARHAVVVLPGEVGAFSGMEYPEFNMLYGEDNWPVGHELAHEYFYGLVGNDQGRDPWLDESFAEYARAVVDDTPTQYAANLKDPYPIGGSVESYKDTTAYTKAVYSKGAGVLLDARQAGPADPWDKDIKCYLKAMAWRVAVPADVAVAVGDLPPSMAALRRGGALP